MANEPLSSADSTTQQNAASPMMPTLLVGNQSSPFGSSLTQIPTVKLEKNNFLFWKHMVMPIIKGHNLEGFLTGDTKCPQEFEGNQVTREDGTTVEVGPNPEYRKWIAIDQLLMGWLYSTMTPEIALRVMGATSSQKLWNAIQEIFGVMNKSRITFLTAELQKTRKGSMTIDQYLNTLKNLTDNLEIAGKSVSNCDLVNQAQRNTLLLWFKSTVECISWTELQSVLMTFESRLEQLNALRNGMAAVNLSQMSANMAQMQNFTNRGGRSNRARGRNSNHRGAGRNRGRGRRAVQVETRKEPCQICGKLSHIAKGCWYRYDDDQEQYKGNQPSAMVASASTVNDPAWFADSGASNHVTANLDNIIEPIEYGGQINQGGSVAREA